MPFEDERPRLGHTGGTLDKLESIPGFRVEPHRRVRRGVRDAGVAITGQPADLRARRWQPDIGDVTATVDLDPTDRGEHHVEQLIAAGAQAIVLDVKVGDGAFMRTLPEARELAEAMREPGHAAGREVVCLLTDMDQPLGRAVGNALEIREALATIRGDGPPDFAELVLAAVLSAGRAFPILA